MYKSSEEINNQYDIIKSGECHLISVNGTFCIIGNSSFYSLEMHNKFLNAVN